MPRASKGTEVCQAPLAPLAFPVSQARLAPQARCVVLDPVVPLSCRPWNPDCSEAGRTPTHGHCPVSMGTRSYCVTSMSSRAPQASVGWLDQR